MSIMKKSLVSWLILGVTTIGLVAYFLFFAQFERAGDIFDYFGITETLLAHRGLHLTPETKQTLSDTLSPDYLTSYYNIAGRDGNYYPVHFIFYSVLAIPVRLAIAAAQLDQLKTFWLLNILIFSVSMTFIWKRYLKSSKDRTALLVLTLISPLLFFFKWPGPDLFYLCMLLIALFAFFNKEVLFASLLIALASWHSQPLIVLTGLTCLYYIFTEQQSKTNNKLTDIFVVIKSAAAGSAAIVPYLYNYWIFGVPTPWSKIPDGWTKLYGFGLHNLSFHKFFEQLFDLNMGVFWYAPALFLLAIGASILSSKSMAKKLWLVTLGFIITAFFYQTNPAWHYGTVGYGPSRHSVFLASLLVYASWHFITQRNSKRLFWPLLIAATVLQLPSLWFNDGLEPRFTNTHQHTPLATFVLNYHPSWYSPTPEIFQDRTNHFETDLPVTAIYKNNGKCTKAFVLFTDMDKLVAECGHIPSDQLVHIDDQFSRKANYARKLTTNKATLIPDSKVCNETSESSRFCVHTIEDAIAAFAISEDRIKQATKSGSWELKEGNPVSLTIPPGYHAQYNSFEGVYVTF
jgi:hypothetical protein